MDSRRERRIEGWADTCDTQKCRMRIKRVKGQESLPPVAKRAQRTEGWRRPDTHPGPVGTDPVAAPAVFSGQGFAKPGITLEGDFRCNHLLPHAGEPRPASRREGRNRRLPDIGSQPLRKSACRRIGRHRDKCKNPARPRQNGLAGLGCLHDLQVGAIVRQLRPPPGFKRKARQKICHQSRYHQFVIDLKAKFADLLRQRRRGDGKKCAEHGHESSDHTGPLAGKVSDAHTLRSIETPNPRGSDE